MEITDKAKEMLFFKEILLEPKVFTVIGNLRAFCFAPKGKKTEPTDEFPALQEDMSELEMLNIALGRPLSMEEREVFFSQHPEWFI